MVSLSNHEGRTPKALFRLGTAVLALAAAVAVCPVTARDFEVGVDGRQLVMALAGHIVSVPGPLWSAPGATVDIENTQVVYRQVGPGAESVLLLPAEETLVTWTRIMGVLAVGRPGYVGAYQVASMVGPMTEDCAPAQRLISKVPAIEADGLEGLLLMCGHYRPTRAGPRNCAGGVVLAVVIDSGKGAVKVYNEWCTDGFDVRDRATWPVSGEELQTIARELQTATAFVPARAGAPAGGELPEAPAPAPGPAPVSPNGR